MKYYVHEFRVRMIVEDVPGVDNAKRWMHVRLNGGDATFEIDHTGDVQALTLAESDVFRSTGKLPSKKCRYRLMLGGFDRWVILHPEDDRLAWSGSQWVQHHDGIGILVQVSNFETREAAIAMAEEQIP